MFYVIFKDAGYDSSLVIQVQVHFRAPLPDHHQRVDRLLRPAAGTLRHDTLVGA